jgi:hypothetical protein
MRRAEEVRRQLQLQVERWMPTVRELVERYRAKSRVHIRGTLSLIWDFAMWS